MAEQATLFDVPASTLAPARISGGAVLSPCGVYRYRLWRQWEWTDPQTVAFVMLNPSTADAEIDDPTIRRCVGYARRWGYGRLEVVNLFALRATDPEDVEAHAAPVGPENDRHLLEVAQGTARVVCAWGTNGALHRRAPAVVALLQAAGVGLWALKITKGGAPGHPLYLPGDLEPMRWEGAPNP